MTPRPRRRAWARAGLASLAVLAATWGAAAPARADQAELAFLRLEPLGLDARHAANLEALFRAELERVGGRLASRQEVEALLERNAPLRACTGETSCLSAIGRGLGVRRVVWGSVGELGDSYVVNLKLVDARRGVEERRVAETMRGSADDLIEEVRVAAHRLVVPDSVRGAIAVESDVAGARVLVDGRAVGETPLGRPIEALPVGEHVLRLEADGFLPFSAEVEVRFQKTSEVAVRLEAAAVGPLPAPGRRRTWVSSPWTYVAVGAAAILTGVLVGRALAPDPVVDCGGGRCP